MPLLLRKIRKSKWYKADSMLWLKQGEIQADALGDIVTTSNTLSVWLVEDNKSNLKEVIVALAVCGDTISNFDYTLIDVDLLWNVGIKIETKEGLSPYSRANHWHRDIVELTTSKILKLAEAIFLHSDRKRVAEKEVLTWVKDVAQSGQIDQTKLKPGITKKLN